MANDINNNDIMPFALPTNAPSIIKVIGVGGGGSNAVKNMYKEGIHDVTFVLCNTDRQALANSEIPVKIQLGHETTGGLGAGNDPEVARAAAEESIEDIKNLFRDETQMVFITAGMGGGTGTGAAPVVARVAKEMGILTIGIVTIPFRFELKKKIIQALHGVEEIAKNVDALLVINNERLREIYPSITIKDGFRVVDETLTTATKSIAEIITVEGDINLDFRDVSKILKDGGVAIMSYGVGSGEKRLENAIENALHSPLLNNNDIYNSKKILFNLYQSTKKPLIVEEIEELNKFMEKFEREDIEVIWGLADDAKLDEEVKITVLATGFGMGNIPGMEGSTKATEPIKKQTNDEDEKNLQMMEVYYGPSKHSTKRFVRSFILEEADLDNDKLISEIENSATYKRTSMELNKLEKKREEKELPINMQEGETTDPGTIIF